MSEINDELVLTPDRIKELAEQNTTIPSEEIEKDIADTEYEIAELTRKLDGYRLIGDKLSMLQVSACESGISTRRRFITQVKAILQYRKEHENDRRNAKRTD